MKFLKEYLTIITVLTILLSFLNIYSYYELFGIEIYNYLETSEIIFSFSSVLISLFLVIPAALISTVYHGVIGTDKVFTLKTDFKELETSMDYIINGVILLGNNIYRIMGFLFIIITFFFFFTTDMLKDTPEWFFIFFLLLVFTYFGTMYIKGITNPLYNSEFIQSMDQSVKLRYHAFMQYFFIIASLIGFTYFRNYVRYENICKGFTRTEISLTDKSGKDFKSNDTLLFIGSTRSSYLFYNLKSKHVTILNSSDQAKVVQKQIRKTL